jgi:4-hydroxy-3-polyprenylbenzoate decarboxylase
MTAGAGESPGAHVPRIVVGITGASGAAYARRLVECLCAGGAHVHLVVTPFGRRLLNDELGIRDVSPRSLAGRDDAPITVYAYQDVGANIASGSFRTDGMIVCPCSSNTLGAIAAGLGDNVLDRAAAVTLKEGRRLIIVPREAPVSPIDLRNYLRLSRAGAIICPAAPGFYMLPRTIDDLVDFVVGKLLDLVGVPHALNTRWEQPHGRDTAPPPEGAPA